MMNNWNDGWDWGDWTAMGLMMLVVALVLVGLTIAGVAWSTRLPRHRSYGSPRDLLDRRLAAGEISQDEYVQARRAIEESPATTP